MGLFDFLGLLFSAPYQQGQQTTQRVIQVRPATATVRAVPQTAPPGVQVASSIKPPLTPYQQGQRTTQRVIQYRR